MTRRILHVAGEVQPLMKTGGLADAVAGLAGAHHHRGQQVHILMPAYADTLSRFPDIEPEPGYQPPRGLEGTRLLRTRLPSSGVPVWLLEAPGFSNRPGNPYTDDSGQEQLDNDLRFARLSRVAVALAAGYALRDWHAQVLHCHDWHAGMTPVYAMLQRLEAVQVFTIHNLGYDGRFPLSRMPGLQLPPWLWHPEALEFHDRLSFLKGGLAFSDAITTVSPTYAREIMRPDYGEGFQGLLRHRRDDLTGILNGVDYQVWDPETDIHLPYHYSRSRPGRKYMLRRALRKEFRLPNHRDVPLICMVGRLVPQKGVDLVLDALSLLGDAPFQLIVLGSGDAEWERRLEAAAEQWPEHMRVHVGYEEALAHRLIAGSDMLLMPSRFEPCGLVQLQALRYGTVPVVRETGGLADTVVDATPRNLRAGTATGIVFDAATAGALAEAMRRAMELYSRKTLWWTLIRQAMRQDHSWSASAGAYEMLYEELLAEQASASRRIIGVD